MGFTEKFIRFWLPVVALLCLMYYFSTDALSGEATRSAVRGLVGRLLMGLSDQTVWAINVALRKAAHFIEYAVLAALLFRACRADDPRRWRLRWAAFSLAAVIAVALLDEYHQSLTRSRDGTLGDVLLDTAGGLTALAALALASRKPARDLKSEA